MKKTGKTYRRTRRKSTYVSKGTGSKIIHTSYGDIAKPRTRRIMRIKPKEVNIKDTRKLVSKANAKLKSLSRKFKSGTWATRKLQTRLSSNKLNMWTKNGRIKVPKKLNKTQLTALNKAINQFLVSKTSTKKGISEVRKSTIEQLQRTWSTEENKMSYEDAEKFYELFGENEFQSIADKIGSSALQVVIQDAIEEDDSEAEFIDRLRIYTGEAMNDLDLREKAKSLYEKYVK